MRMMKPFRIARIRRFVTLTFSMSASYDFGDTSCPVCHLPIIPHLLNGYRFFKKFSKIFLTNVKINIIIL
jgi:hypothetical protein